MLIIFQNHPSNKKNVKYLSHNGESHFFYQIQRKVRLAKLEVVLKNADFT